MSVRPVPAALMPSTATRTSAAVPQMVCGAAVGHLWRGGQAGNHGRSAAHSCERKCRAHRHPPPPHHRHTTAPSFSWNFLTRSLRSRGGVRPSMRMYLQQGGGWAGGAESWGARAGERVGAGVVGGSTARKEDGAFIVSTAPPPRTATAAAAALHRAHSLAALGAVAGVLDRVQQADVVRKDKELLPRVQHHLHIVLH